MYTRRVLLSTKTKLINYIKPFWQKGINLFLPEWCFECQYRLKANEHTVCMSCLGWLFDPRFLDGEAVILVPIDSTLSEIITAPISAFKQHQLLEALYLKYLIEHPVGEDTVIMYGEDRFKAFSVLLNTYTVLPVNTRCSWQDKKIIFFSSYARLIPPFKTYARLSKVQSFKAVCLYA